MLVLKVPPSNCFNSSFKKNYQKNTCMILKVVVPMSQFSFGFLGFISRRGA